MTSTDSPSDRRGTRATLADVARLAGVSAKTVSRVVSGEPNVAPATRDAVLEAAARLRFRPNRLAAGLRGGGVSRTVGFVVGDLGNPFYAAVAAGMERELTARGLTLVLAATEDDPAAERTAVDALLAERVRGLVVVPIAGDSSHLAHEQRLGTPVVALDRPARGLEVDTVVLDNVGGARSAVAALTAAGHRDIAFLGTPAELVTLRDRLEGYRAGLAAAGLETPSAWERLGDHGDAGLVDVVRELVDRPDPPTAVLAANNRASTAVVRALGPRPDPVLVGFDDFELADALGISVVTYDAARLGQEAARCVLDRLEEPDAPARRTVVPTTLVRRGRLSR
ncbi:LacI family DNA-binding transcriptional regulator [Isoptericola chiayiensis]|uniref:LacI family DNA-binding transcriptional regulator n=1 Tax=Isoptericola chiayiensis TaxID=579446 RepID=A0ABP8Y681_9MICO|nr:LacI family DNA-binding transcriptional regulator [Isoptericola chiayiensis]NOV99200.1 LacI family transcriptional regulator [Isoptericola chiayiensis]